MLGTIPMHALWRTVVFFIIKIMKKSIIPNPQIEQGDKQDCVIEEKIGSVALAEIQLYLVVLLNHIRFGLNSLQI
jgi:hypothetical protein